MTVTSVYRILILLLDTNHYKEYCSKKFLKYSILCGVSTKLSLTKLFFKLK